jgi:hypothetical protein
MGRATTRTGPVVRGGKFNHFPGIRKASLMHQCWHAKVLPKRQVNELISPLGGFAAGIQKNQIVNDR